MSTITRSILITSASGNIGQKLIPLLLSTPSTASYTIVVPTRDAARLRTNLGLPDSPSSHPNLIVAEGDTTNTPWIESLLRTHAVDTVLSNFSGIEELALTLNFWSACEATGVKHLVYISACFDTSLEAVRAGALRHVGAAHCAYKFPAEQRLVYGGPKFSWTILAPTLFMQTNSSYVQKTVMEMGLIGFPVGEKGCSMVDTADIALGAFKAIEDQGKVWGGKKIAIGSREVYNTEAMTKLWSKATGKEIKGVSARWEDLEKLEEQVALMGADRRGRGGWAWARDMVLMCEQFDLDGFGMTDEQYQEQVKFLGKEASSYEEYVKGLVAKWKTEA